MVAFEFRGERNEEPKELFLLVVGAFFQDQVFAQLLEVEFPHQHEEIGLFLHLEIRRHKREEVSYDVHRGEKRGFLEEVVYRVFEVIQQQVLIEGEHQVDVEGAIVIDQHVESSDCFGLVFHPQILALKDFLEVVQEELQFLHELRTAFEGLENSLFVDPIVFLVLEVVAHEEENQVIYLDELVSRIHTLGQLNQNFEENRVEFLLAGLHQGLFGDIERRDVFFLQKHQKLLQILLTVLQVNEPLVEEVESGEVGVEIRGVDNLLNLVLLHLLPLEEPSDDIEKKQRLECLSESVDLEAPLENGMFEGLFETLKLPFRQVHLGRDEPSRTGGLDVAIGSLLARNDFLGGEESGVDIEVVLDLLHLTVGDHLIQLILGGESDDEGIRERGPFTDDLFLLAL